MKNVSPKDEFDLLASTIRRLLPRYIDGREAILQMKNEGSNNWRQMEWIGFWFEHFVETQIKKSLHLSNGPTYGHTTFDIQRNFIWDLKAHPTDKKSLILNDKIAIYNCLFDHSGLGFIVLNGHAEYDDESQSFKKWHDKLKGEISSYEKNRIARGARSRKRKISFKPENLDGIWLDNQSRIEELLNIGLLDEFQKDMRNSDGKPRDEKIMVKDYGHSGPLSIANLPLI